MKPHRLLAWLLCVLVGACALQPKEPPRILMQGFSFSVPKEKENDPAWLVAKKGPDVTVIGKPGRFSGEAFTIQATIVQLPAFASSGEMVRYLETSQRKELDPKRYRLFKLEVTPQKIHEQACALSRAEFAERVTAQGTGSPVNVMMETLTLICPHPNEPTRGINLAYSHRHFPEDVDPQFSEDAAAFMQTLAFEPL
jgi:hypothetical protein